MHLIILYGPPGAGKLTIAEALAERLAGYKVFQNNPTVQAVTPLFEFGTQEFSRALHRMRVVLFEELARSQNAGAIFTFCYDFKNDDPYIADYTKAVLTQGGTVHLIQVICEKATLYQRIGNESRKPHKKLSSPERMDAMIARYDMWTPHPETAIVINTDELEPDAAVDKIVSGVGMNKPEPVADSFGL